MRRSASRLFLVSLFALVLTLPASAADTASSDTTAWDQYVSWTTDSGDTGLSLTDWVTLMARLGVPIG